MDLRLLQQQHRESHKQRQVSLHQGCGACHALAVAVELVPQVLAVFTGSAI